MRPTLVAQLRGGLGNQLFQYAMAAALAEASGADLSIDERTGFRRDRRFRRRYELGAFTLRGRAATGAERLVYSLDGCLKPLRMSRRVVRSGPWADFVTETRQAFIPEAASLRVRRLTFAKGYWQSPRYFAASAEGLRRELQPPTPQDASIRRLGEDMARDESVAVGVRLYEEAPDPTANARGGRMKTLEEQGRALAGLLDRLRKPRIFVFCTQRSPRLAALGVPADATYLTADSGFASSVDSLWLMSRCRHHLFNNSSFYWWGAWLAQNRHPLGPGITCAADNFVNEDSLPPDWEQF